jgi:hypothetical protein
MAIDFSTRSSEFWRTTFERYITGGGDLQTLLQNGGVENHFKMCLPVEDYPDKSLEKTPTHYRITGTHPGAEARFELYIDRVTKEWEFKWLD